MNHRGYPPVSRKTKRPAKAGRLLHNVHILDGSEGGKRKTKMMRIEVEDYIAVGATIIGVTYSLKRRDAEEDPERITKLNAEVVRDLQWVLGACKKINLNISAALIEPRLKRPPESASEMRMLSDAVFAELNSKVFLFVPPHRAEYFENETLLSEKARASFPKANVELRKAGNAYAAGLTGATVYYCMGALEHGLRSLAKDVGVTFDIQNWQNVIEEIESKITLLRKTLARGEQRNAKLQFLSEAAKEFLYFKDGWRNYSAHNKIDYDEPQALTVMSHVRNFIEALSRELVE